MSALRSLIPAALMTIAALSASAVAAVAQDWALQGYDPVALVQDGRAEAGQAAIHTQWKGQLWLFTSEDHRATFEGNPRAYAPAFGGLCPVSLAEGQRAAGSPQYFAVVQRRLYLTRSNANRKTLLADPEAILGAARAAYGGE